jgi:hypothetical protein
MNAQKEIEKKIRQKEDEIRRLEHDLIQAKAYMDALRESLKLISRSSDETMIDSIRPGSLVDQARTVIRKAGHPLHVDKIISGMGKEYSKKFKSSLSGSLGQYVRQGIIFTRTNPNTFGLKEFDDQAPDLPDDFGRN